jgi:mitochondrial fission protein ELM1
MKALHCWLLTDGAHGMISQVEGLASAMNATFDHKTVKLKNIFKFIPPKFSPKSKSVFNFSELTKSSNPLPDYLISCGRKSVIPNIVLKSYFKNFYNHNIKNIHIQDPKISSDNFDYIIVPEHDNPLEGNNIIRSVGALHYVTEKEVENSNHEEKLVVCIILGGPNKYYLFSENEIEKFIFNITQAKNNITKINIIGSRRTPPQLFENIKKKFNTNIFNYDFSLKKENYLKLMSEASHIVVTSDSISMISEAAITGKPIYVAELVKNKNDYRFQRFINLFEKLGIIRRLDQTLDYWTYKKLYETKRIANLILNKK